MASGDSEYTSLDFLSKVPLPTVRSVYSPNETSSSTSPSTLTWKRSTKCSPPKPIPLRLLPPSIENSRGGLCSSWSHSMKANGRPITSGRAS